jgi:3-oxoacyl-(acyl-carrier-protein) synthase
MRRQPLIGVMGLGSISAQGHRRDGVFANYARGGTRLCVRTFNGKPTAVGALAAEAEAELAALAQEDPRFEPLDRTVHLALHAARQAAREARWTSEPGERGDATVVLGSSRGATHLWEKLHAEFLANGSTKTAPLTSPTTTLGNISSWVAQELQSHGAATELSSTCSTSLYALTTALAFLRGGMAQRVMTGGAEAPLTDFTVAQMRAVRIYSGEAETEFPCRPCAEDAGRRNTMVLGEGACLLALERFDDERDLGSRQPLAYLLGVGSFGEPIRTNTSLSEDGEALYRSMRAALADAGLARVDAVITHTPGTALGDRGELTAVRRVFGEELPLLTSNKWILGHTLGGSGALGVEYALYLLQRQRWVDYPYPVPFTNTARPIRTVLVNSVGFGGNAGSLVVGAAGAN